MFFLIKKIGIFVAYNIKAVCVLFKTALTNTETSLFNISITENEKQWKHSQEQGTIYDLTVRKRKKV